MIPKLKGIDHIHVYVPSREEAAKWFQEVLGFEVVDSLLPWATDGGPLTIEDGSGSIHLALFQRESFTPSTAIAFGSDSQNFLKWKTLLEEKEILLRCTDHKLAWSVYFGDPYGNSYEITTYDYDEVSRALKA